MEDTAGENCQHFHYADDFRTVPLFPISVLFPCGIPTVIISKKEKVTMTCCATFGATEQKTNIALQY